MTREKKKEVVQQLTEMFDGATGFYSIDFTGLDVANTNELRQNFKQAGVSYRVAKNTLVRRALEESGQFNDILDRLVGQTGVAIGTDDPAAPARVLKKFLEDNKLETPNLNFAVIEGDVFEGAQLKEIAAMPSRTDLIAAIVGSLHSPVSGIVNSINAVLRDLASVMEEVARKQSGAAEA